MSTIDFKVMGYTADVDDLHIVITVSQYDYREPIVSATIADNRGLGEHDRRRHGMWCFTWWDYDHTDKRGAEAIGEAMAACEAALPGILASVPRSVAEQLEACRPCV